MCVYMRFHLKSFSQCGISAAIEKGFVNAISNHQQTKYNQKSREGHYLSGIITFCWVYSVQKAKGKFLDPVTHRHDEANEQKGH